MPTAPRTKQIEAIRDFLLEGGYAFSERPKHEINLYLSARVENKWIITLRPSRVEFVYDTNHPEVHIPALGAIGMFVSYKPYRAAQFEYAPDSRQMTIKGARDNVRYTVLLRHDLPE